MDIESIVHKLRQQDHLRSEHSLLQQGGRLLVPPEIFGTDLGLHGMK
jgi:hypothetical protein